MLRSRIDIRLCTRIVFVMKSKKLPTLITFFAFALSLGASSTKILDKAREIEPVVGSTEEKKVLPEVSNPPYSVGDMATIQGYYISLEDDVSLNFRILNNRMYVYWVDTDGLILEPQATSGNVRFIANVRGPFFYKLTSLDNEAALGSIGGPVFKPHRFNVILNLNVADGEDLKTHTFRYLPAMSIVREERNFDINENSDPEIIMYDDY